MFDCTELLYTQAVWQCVNPQLDYCIQFTALNTSHTLLTYLQSNAVVLQLWGLQGIHMHTHRGYCKALSPNTGNPSDIRN